MFLQKIKNLFRSPVSAQRVLIGKNILVIDDGEVERKVYSHALESSGAFVTTAATGTLGLAAAQSRRWDLYLLDFSLPDMTGIDICRQLKSNPNTRDIPVIFLTGSVKPEGVINCYDAGADCYLAKPISAVALIQQVRAALLDQNRS